MHRSALQIGMHTAGGWNEMLKNLAEPCTTANGVAGFDASARVAKRDTVSLRIPAKRYRLPGTAVVVEIPLNHVV